MTNKSKLACAAAFALASIASPLFAQAATTTAHRHHYVHRPVYSSRTAAGYRANAAIRPSAGPAANPVNDPAMTGGGSAGYNVCAGHPAC
jgi:hypothetical protein